MFSSQTFSDFSRVIIVNTSWCRMHSLQPKLCTNTSDFTFICWILDLETIWITLYLLKHHSTSPAGGRQCQFLYNSQFLLIITLIFEVLDVVYAAQEGHSQTENTKCVDSYLDTKPFKVKTQLYIKTKPILFSYSLPPILCNSIVMYCVCVLWRSMGWAVCVKFSIMT